MTYPTHLGQLTIEEDANILKTLLDVGGAAFVMTDPFYTYTLLPYTTEAHDIGSTTLFYDTLFIDYVIFGNNSLQLGTLYAVSDYDTPQIVLNTVVPNAGAGNWGYIGLRAEGPAGSTDEDAAFDLTSGDDDTQAPRIDFAAGDADMYLEEGFGLWLDSCYRLKEQSADPTAPVEGNMVLWQSDGTGAGDDGDIMVKIQAGATTKTVTLIDFSAA